MRRTLIALSLSLAASTVSAQWRPPACSTEAAIDSLRRAALRLYPSAAADSSHNSFVTIAIVVDEKCAIQKHAIGRRSGRVNAETLITRLIPESAGNTYPTSGFAALVSPTADERLKMWADSAIDLGIPWLVWGRVK